jgi:hypothetical protein
MSKWGDSFVAARFRWYEKSFHPFAHLRGSSLCRRDIPVTSARETIGWWETRRIPFNLIVGIAGMISTVVVCVVGLGSYFLFDGDFGFPPPLFAVFEVLLYGIAANVFLPVDG